MYFIFILSIGILECLCFLGYRFSEGWPCILFCHSKLFVLNIFVFSTFELMSCVVVMWGLRLMMKIQQWWALSGLMIGYTLKHDLVRSLLNYLALILCLLSAFWFAQKREKRNCFWDYLDEPWFCLSAPTFFFDFSLCWYCSPIYLDVVCLVVYAKKNAYKTTPFPSKLLYNLI